jgi:hypothetical protein
VSTAPTLATPRPSEAAMALLSNGIPLSLLLDLAFGPRSRELLVHERSTSPAAGPPAA